MTTALVLGGGGITGVAWETGLLAGLAEAGVDLTTAGTVVGTSAGSIVGTQVACGDSLEQMYVAQLRDPTGETAARMDVGMMLRYVAYFASPGSSRTKLRRIGRAALRARSGDESERVEVIRGALGDRRWPERRLLITAVDAVTGDFTVWDKGSGVDLVLAVASSCAVPLVWPPVTINGSRYVDGGMRSAANADLARGADRVIVLAPLTRSASRAGRVENQLARLGSHVRSVTITPDHDSKLAIGKNLLDPAHRAASARAGREQAAKVVDQVRAVWSA